jgi:hypothetical protein
MRLSQSVPKGSGYVVTELGRHDVLCAPLCVCDVKLVGLLFECPECGTVYGTLRETAYVGWGRGPEKSRRD